MSRVVEYLERSATTRMPCPKTGSKIWARFPSDRLASL